MNNHPAVEARNQHDKAILQDALRRLAQGGESALPISDSAFALVAPCIQLSCEDWALLLNSHPYPPSQARCPLLRPFMPKTIHDQAEDLATGVYESNPGAESERLARRIAEMPFLMRVVLIDLIERFWAGAHQHDSLEETLKRLGVPSCETSHARLQARKHRARLDRLLLVIE